MVLVLEIAAGVAGVVIGFFILANWASIVNGVERTLGIAILIALAAGVSFGLAWGIAALKGATPTADQLNVSAGNIMGGIGAVGVLAYLSFQFSRSVRRLLLFARDRLNRRKDA